MLAYLIRRYLLTLILAPLLAYSLVLYMPLLTGPVVIVCHHQGCAENIERIFHLDKAWPLNYAAYMFDPHATVTVDGNGDTITKLIDINLFGFHIKGSGALTGDFGTSTILFPIGTSGTSVNQLFGNSLGEMYAVILCVLVILISVATLQQRTKPKVYTQVCPPDLQHGWGARRIFYV